MRLLFFGTYDARKHPRVEVLAEGFRAAGDTVVECNVPLGLDTADRVRILKQPWLLPVFALRVLAAWLRLAARSRRVGAFDAVVVGYLGPLDVRLARRLWPRKRIALDQLTSVSDTAADRAVGGQGVLSKALVAVDRGAAKAADVVVVDTEEQRPTVLAEPREGVVVVPVGAPTWWFTEPRALPPSPLRVVFFGLYTPLQGTPAVAEAIALLADEPGVTFTMIGRGQDYDTARALAGPNPRVDWVDWVDPVALVDVVAGHHVCLGVFGTGPKAQRVVPNKVYQGAAAGCVVVTSDTPPQRTMLGEAALYVVPGDAAALATTLRGLAADPARVDALRHAAYDLADSRFRPEHVIAPLRARLMRGTR